MHRINRAIPAIIIPSALMLQMSISSPASAEPGKFEVPQSTVVKTAKSWKVGGKELGTDCKSSPGGTNFGAGILTYNNCPAPGFTVVEKAGRNEPPKVYSDKQVWSIFFQAASIMAFPIAGAAEAAGAMQQLASGDISNAGGFTLGRLLEGKPRETGIEMIKKASEAATLAKKEGKSPADIEGHALSAARKVNGACKP